MGEKAESGKICDYQGRLHFDMLVLNVKLRIEKEFCTQCFTSFEET